MERTEVATALLDGVSAHRTLGLRVLAASGGEGRAELPVTDPVCNVIGALHSSGLTALVDAAALAAMISLAPDDATARRLQPLGARTEIVFRRPVRGTALACCRLDQDTARTLGRLYRGEVEKARLTTLACVDGHDEPGAVTGRFDWSVRLGRE